MSNDLPVMSEDNPSSWFEPLYAGAAGEAAQVPWALGGPAPYLTDWLARQADFAGKPQAVVVGCGLGDDAEALASAGFAVTAFDVSPSAIAWAKQRFPHSAVDYRVADLFDLPDEWCEAFDLVFEFRTIQALPLEVRPAVMMQIAALPKPGGTVLVATYLRPEETLPEGPPWPLSEQELAYFEELGLQVISQQRFSNSESAFRDRILVEYQAPD